MGLSMRAPDLRTLVQRGWEAGAGQMMSLLARTDLDDEYRHWDQLRHRTPPEGLTTEQWWMILRMRRAQSARILPLYQASGEPFSYVLTDRIIKASEEIARRTGGAREASAAVTAEGRETFMVRSLVEEAMTSSQLEGAVTSRREAKELLESGRAPVDKSELMILNNYEAMRRAREVFADTLTPDLVKELHSILTDGTLDEPRDAGRIQRPGEERVAVYDQREKIVHAPPPAEQLEHRLATVCSFASADPDDGTYVPAVVRAIVLHFMFGYDHYFVDGNGRTARTVFFWSMLHSGHWLTEYLSISRILRKAPGQYSTSYEYAEDDAGDLTYFIHHQLDVILRALDDLDTYIETRRLRDERVRAELSRTAIGLNFRQVDLLERLGTGSLGAVTATAYANRYRVTGQTARNDLHALVRSGHLVERRHPGRGRGLLWTLPTQLDENTDTAL